jgi:hypothetical protein
MRICILAPIRTHLKLAAGRLQFKNRSSVNATFPIVGFLAFGIAWVDIAVPDVGDDMRLEDRIRNQFPTLSITLLSVLIALFFSDLVAEAHSRMTLWPLDVGTLRTWAQIFAMGTCALSSWVFLAHMGISRLRIPTLDDSLVVFLAPVPLLIGNAFVGLREIWPWFYYGSFFLVMSLGATLMQVSMARKERELASFARLAKPFGPVMVFYVGIPFYAAAAWADRHDMVSPLVELLLAVSVTPAALLFTHLFVRDWHRAIAEAIEWEEKNKP